MALSRRRDVRRAIVIDVCRTFQRFLSISGVVYCLIDVVDRVDMPGALI